MMIQVARLIIFINLFVMYNTCVYRHIRLDKNEPFYIGIGSPKRPYTTDSRTKYWHNIVKKTDYRVDILFDNLSFEKAKEKEKEFIKLYGRKDLGLGSLINMTDGGDGVIGLKHSIESRKKMSDSLRGRKLTKEQKINIGNASRGRKYPDSFGLAVSKRMKNKPKSEETKQRISYTLTGKKQSKQTCLKKSKSLQGRKLTEEHCKKISLSLIGNKQAQGSINKAAFNRSKYKLLVYFNGKLLAEYRNANIAQKELNISNLYKIVKGERKNNTKFTFERIKI